MRVTVEEIEVPEELVGLKMEAISTQQRNNLRHKYGPFDCAVCGQVAVKRVLTDVGDKEQSGIRLQKYCEKCFKQMQREEQTTLLTATNGKDKVVAVREKKSHSGA